MINLLLGLGNLAFQKQVRWVRNRTRVESRDFVSEVNKIHPKEITQETGEIEIRNQEKSIFGMQGLEPNFCSASPSVGDIAFKQHYEHCIEYDKMIIL